MSFSEQPSIVIEAGTEITGSSVSSTFTVSEIVVVQPLASVIKIE